MSATDVRPLLIGHNDGPSGAGRAVARLHEGLLAAEVSSQLLVALGQAGLAQTHAARGPLRKGDAVLRAYLDQLPLRLYRGRANSFYSTGFAGGNPARRARNLDHNLTHLHWHCGGLLSPRNLPRLRGPLVWTIHDSWAFTGGCHVPGECDRFTQECGRCPQLASQSAGDWSRRLHRQKARAWRSLRPTLLAPSEWMAASVRRSSLLGAHDVAVVPNVIDTERYRAFGRREARARLGLPQDARLVLFGAINARADHNKGYDLLTQSLAALAERDRGVRKPAKARAAPVMLVVFGDTRDPRATSSELPFPVLSLGRFTDDLTLALVYSAADVMCVPSRQESFGQTAAEAMACGVPVVAFGATGLLDIVDHRVNGYLARPYDPADFAEGIAQLLNLAPAAKRKISAAARQKVEDRFRRDIIVAKHIALYEQVLRDARDLSAS